MSWFRRHLNWTYILGTVILPFGVVFPLLVYWQAPTLIHYVGSVVAGVISIFSLLVGVFALVISLLIPVWVLKQKGRSLWWCWAPPWMVLVLKNERRQHKCFRTN